MKANSKNSIAQYNSLKEKLADFFKGSVYIPNVFFFESPSGEKLTSCQHFSGIKTILPLTDAVLVLSVSGGFTNKANFIPDKEETCILDYKSFMMEFGNLFEPLNIDGIDIPECKIMLADTVKSFESVKTFFERQ